MKKTTRNTVVWVTGARTGIGRAIALAFAERGAKVAVSSRQAAGLKALADRAKKKGWRVMDVACDVTNPESVGAAYGAIRASLGEVDVLVNNAGATVFKSFLDTGVKEMDTVLAANLRGPFLCTQAVLPGMVRRGGGMIIMINSVAAKKVFKNSSVYSATKAGLKAMADCIREEYRDRNIAVTSIFPGATATPIWPEAVRRNYRNRMMKPEDVASAVINAWLTPDRAMVEEIQLRPVGGDLD